MKIPLISILAIHASLVLSAQTEIYQDDDTGRRVVASGRSAEVSAISQINSLFKIYYSEHGTYPTNWSEVTTEKEILDNLSDSLQRPIVDVFGFVLEDDSIDELSKGNLHLVALSPHKRTSDVVRLLIYSNEEGDLQWMPMKEDEYQVLKSKYGFEVVMDKGTEDSKPLQADRLNQQSADDGVVTVESEAITVKPETSPESQKAIIESQEEQSESNSIWPWAFGGLALIAGIAWALSSRKNRGR